MPSTTPIYTPPPLSANDTSLIITTYNAKERLGLVLDSVANLNPLPKEIIIADDGSTEDTKELIESYASNFPRPIKHIWQEDKGFRAAMIRNKGIQAATTPYIILIDGDMILDSAFIVDHIRFARPNVILQGSRTMLSPEVTQTMIESYKNGDHSAYMTAFKHKSWKAYRCAIFAYLIYYLSTSTKRIFDTRDRAPLGSANMAFYKVDWEKIGGFNEAFVGHGSEDYDFVARFLFAGGKARRVKFAAVGYHIHHPMRSQHNAQKNSERYQQTLATYRKGIYQ